MVRLVGEVEIVSMGGFPASRLLPTATTNVVDDASDWQRGIPLTQPANDSFSACR